MAKAGREKEQEIVYVGGGVGAMVLSFGCAVVPSFSLLMTNAV